MREKSHFKLTVTIVAPFLKMGSTFPRKSRDVLRIGKVVNVLTFEKL